MPFRFQFAGHSVECASAAALPVRLVVDGVSIECDTLGEVMPAIELVSSLNRMNGTTPPLPDWTTAGHADASNRINGALNGAPKISKEMSKAAAIRAYLADHPTADNAEVLDALALCGFHGKRKPTGQEVSVQRSSLGLGRKRKQSV